MSRKYVGHLIVKQKIRVVFDFEGGDYRELERAALITAMDNGMIDEEHDGVWIEFVEPMERLLDAKKEDRNEG